jgi:hypothetical protein
MERKMRRPFRSTVLATLLAASWWQPAPAQSTVPDLEKEIRQRAAQIENTLIGWRRDIHEHPELGEQETRTAGLVADHLRKLGLEVKTGVAQTGVIAVLRGGKPGPVVALRADMDALPVKEPEGLPFASKAKGKYLGREVDRDARLRPRRPYGHPDGDRRAAHRHEGQITRHSEVHVPAGRGRPKPLCGVYRQDLGGTRDDQGGRAARSQA